MNPIVIALGVMLIAIILMTIFGSFFSGKSTMIDKINFKAGTVPNTLGTALTNPFSSSRTYSIWIYVNAWTTEDKNMRIFGRENDIVLYLKKGSSVLECKVQNTSSPSGLDAVLLTDVNGSNSNDNLTNVVDVTNDFPLQKWVFVTISIDSTNVVDYYLDGKLVKSIKMNSTQVPTSKDIIYGIGTDIWIAKFNRSDTSSSPQQVWDMYSNSNPGSNIKDLIGNYNVNMSILTDNVVSSSINLF